MKPLKGKLWSVGALLLVVGAVVYWVLSATALPLDENLVRTQTRPRSGPPGGGQIQRLAWKYYDLKSRIWPNPLAHRFSPSPERSCRIGSLLNQCMETSGTRYLIEKRVETGNVMFGHTNVLNGEQWTHAFERALQKNSPQWYDMEEHKFESANLVLLRYDKRTVLVLTPETAKEYRAKYPKLAPLER